MPYKNEWVDPEVALEYKGIVLYHVYKDDDVDQGAYTHTFALDPYEDSDYEGNPIVVHDLPNWTEPPHPPFMGVDGDNSPENKAAWAKYCADDVERQHILQVLRDAIDLWYLPPPKEA